MAGLDLNCDRINRPEDRHRTIGVVPVRYRFCTAHNLRVELPTSAEVRNANFEDRALNQKIKAAEGQSDQIPPVPLAEQERS